MLGTGQYAHCMGAYQEALRHFAAVSKCMEGARDPAELRVMAGVHTAMTELEAGGEEALFRACEALKEAGVYEVPPTLPENVRLGPIMRRFQVARGMLGTPSKIREVQGAALGVGIAI